MVLAPDTFNGLAGMRPTVGIGRDVDDAQVDSKEVLDLDRGLVGQVCRGQQEELPAAIDQVGLSLHPVEPLALVLAIHQGQNHPPAERPQAHLIEPLETQDPLIVDDGPTRPKRRALALVPPEGFDGLVARSHCHLCGQPESLADLGVAPLVDARLGKTPASKPTLAANVAASLNRSIVASKTGL